MGASLEALGRLLIRRRLTASALLLVLTLAALFAAAPRFEGGSPIDFTPQALFSQDAEATEALSLRRWWGKDDNEVMVLLEGPIFTPEGLEALGALHAALAEQTGAPVASLVSLGVASRQPDGALVVAPLVSGGSPTPEQVADIRERALAEPSLVGAAVAPDGGTATLRVRLPDALERVAELRPAVKQIRAVVAGASLPPGFRAWVTGIPEVRVTIVEQLIHDQLHYLPADALIFAVVLSLLFRGLVPGVLPLLAVGMAVVWATGLLLGAGVTFNVLSSLIPALVLVIGVSDGIHLLARYRTELALDRDREAAMGRTLRHLAVACFLTSFTTAVGFASLMVASSRALQEFGLQSALAVMVAYVAVVIGLPTLLGWVSVERVLRRGRRAEGPGPLDRGLARLDREISARPGWTVLACLALTAPALVIGAGVSTNSHMMELFPADHPAVRAYRAVVDHGGGIIPVFIHLEADEVDAFRDPALLRRMDALEVWLAGQPEVRWTASPASALRVINRALTGADALPADRATVEQELFLMELGGDREEPLEAVVDPEWRVARILGLSTDAGGHVFNALAERMRTKGLALFEGTGVRVIAAGDGVVASAGVHRIIDDLLYSVGLAFGIIGLTLLALLRSPRLTLLALIPNALPMFFTLATLGLMGASIQTGNVVSFAVALGLAVDDTIHYLVRFREELAGGLPAPEAIRATTVGVGPALVFTSVLLIAGLGLLATSDLIPTKHFGILAISTLSAALMADLVLLPATLYLLARRLASR